ncbi:restriction endonuclease subunit S [Odoribacter splanchnicus]|uniref:restriction endonuclease subunit S n=2 Tax=Bacteroidia TaxID=200643 RepID=UPI001C384E7F|nr:MULTISPECIES: restriction endonuclease subunit S [Bacteroidales]MBV4399106.1 restriction endonuclease subunit S [Odoribacter splanchnicus]MBV4407412.1 restriction endonuclease subunit S [Odoribacter splanchnicus]MCG5001544.1 restriction endonuclease subunit S [Odoribacter splanchnicus]MCQ5264765.1 restriction endonuclease subunit S [Phocaeicola vulgatus]
MTNNKDKKVLNVPNLRFPEFTGEWMKCKFGEIATGFDYGMNAAAKPYDGQNKYIRITDIDEASSTYNNSSIVSPDGILSENYVVNEGDILLARTGASTGKSYLYRKSDGKLYYAGFLIRANVAEHNPYFVFSQLHTHRYWRWVSIMSARSGQPGINSLEYASFPIFTTTLKEENKISSLLSLIDERITTQNKIIEDLKKLKSAISLKMLHSDSWEQFRIKDIAIIGRGRVISSVEISQQKNPTYPVYSSQTSNEGIMGYLDDYMFEGEYISWTTDGANAGTVFYRNGKFNCTNVCGLLKLKKGFDTHFVSLVLAEATKKYVSVNLANPKLMNNTMGNIQIRLPKLEEQKRISIVFRRLHELLAIHNNLLTEYSKQKQYLLSQMFI